MKAKNVVIWLFAIVAITAINIWNTTVDPLVGSKLAAETVNGGDSAFMAQRLYEGAKEFGWGLKALLSFFVALGAWALTRNKAQAILKRASESVGVLVSGSIITLGMTGCKPFNTPEYVEVRPSETAYFIPLVGDNKEAQAQFDSKAYESYKKVGIKRILVPKEWLPTGRMNSDGKWIPTARIIIVDRSSENRFWTKEQNKGSTKEDQAVSVESKDSVAFSMGFKVTAYVAEEDTSTFLYFNANRIKESGTGSYQVVGLDEIMDNEVLTRIQKVVATEFGKYALDEGRTMKSEVYAKVDADVIPFFKTRGITILTIAPIGGLTYDNPKIQDAIDKTVMDQQSKVSALAEKDAQLVKNETIKLEAEAKASATLTAATAEAQGKFVVQEQIAKGMKLVSDAAKEAGSSDAYIRLQQLDVMRETAKQYKGGVPAVLIIGGNGANGASPLLPITPDVLRQFEAGQGKN